MTRYRRSGTQKANRMGMRCSCKSFFSGEGRRGSIVCSCCWMCPEWRHCSDCVGPEKTILLSHKTLVVFEHILRATLHLGVSVGQQGATGDLDGTIGICHRSHRSETHSKQSFRCRWVQTSVLACPDWWLLVYIWCISVYSTDQLDS